MSTSNDPKELFERWFTIPVRLLEQIPSGDGAIVVFATCLYLYERFAKSLLDSSGKKADDSAFYAQLALDFGLTGNQPQTFWDVARNGFLHQGMPKQSARSADKLPPWTMSGQFTKPVEFREMQGKTVLCIQPWLFRDRVLQLYRDRPELIAQSKSFPWASIFRG
jgi:hypothetical protein